jgi:hypothetical protein
VRAGFPLAGEAGPAAGSVAGRKRGLAGLQHRRQVLRPAHAGDRKRGREDHLGVEEAFIDTTALPDGFSLRAGRFFSNIGYLNSHHAHTDKFFDRPLAYQAFLGNQYGDDGVQVRWVAPTDLFVEVGGEVMRGQNFPSGGAGHAGAASRRCSRTWAATSARELLAGRRVDAEVADRRREDGFRGDENLYIADAPGSGRRAATRRTAASPCAANTSTRIATACTSIRSILLDQLWSGQRSGAYIEGVWRINRTWETGYRYDRLWADDTGRSPARSIPTATALMLTWRNSEFSLFRLQAATTNPTRTDTDNTVTPAIPDVPRRPRRPQILIGGTP